MSIEPTITDNAHFLDKLSHNASPIGITRDGHLFDATGRISAIMARVLSNQARIDTAICSASRELIATKIAEGGGDLRIAWITLIDTIEKLRAHRRLTPELQQGLLAATLPIIKNHYRMTAILREIDSARGVAAAHPLPKSDLAIRATTAMLINEEKFTPEPLRSTFGISAPVGRWAPKDRYYISDDKGRFALFKPSDKEIGMPGGEEPPAADKDYPGYLGGIKLGTQYLRSVAAYEFARGRFGCIPETTLFRITLPDDALGEEHIGALQKEIHDLRETRNHVSVIAKPFIDRGETPTFEDFFDRESAQEMTLLDLLLGHTDRSDITFMVDPATKKVHALENGMTFPDGLMRLDAPLSRTLTHFGIQPDDGVPILPALRDKLLGLDAATESKTLQDKGLINEDQAAEFLIRIKVIQHLLRMELPADADHPKARHLSLRQISAVFIPEDPSAEPLITTLCHTAHDSARYAITAAATPADKHSIYTNAILSTIPKFLTPSTIASLH